MDVKVRLTVRKDRPYTKTPHFHTIRPNSNNEEHYCTTGVDSDIREATRSAVRNMINFLEAEFQMDRVAAYMLCSVAGDLRMARCCKSCCYMFYFRLMRFIWR